MTKTPDLTLPLARLTLFCGHAFTLIRAECWTGMGSGKSPTDSLNRIQSTADTVHNLASFGWHIGEYTQGRASGRALIDTGAHLIRTIKAAEDSQSKDLDEGACFDWSDARAAVEEIVAEIEIVEILGDDVPTTGEHMANVMANMRERILKDKK